MLLVVVCKEQMVSAKNLKTSLTTIPHHDCGYRLSLQLARSYLSAGFCEPPGKQGNLVHWNYYSVMSR